MRAPGFWSRPPGPAAVLLAPLAGLWTLATRRRLARPPRYTAPVPVLCVGNLVAGGAGKTPVVLDLARRLRARGIDARTLSRGHGGRLAGPLAVDPARHGAAAVGDEPLLLAARGPAWIARDRAAGAAALVAAGAGAIIMDDGFQNPDPAKSLSLLVVDGAAGFGNGRVIPAGPLREPLADGLARADGLVLLGEDRAGVAALLAAREERRRLPLLRGRLAPDPAAAAALAGRRVLAFAGIGRPQKFFATLADLGAVLAETLAFADHHPYSRAEIEDLLRRAARDGLVAVTTEKDAVRLPADLRDAVHVLPVTVEWADAAALEGLLDRMLERGHGQAQ
ncbi:tetraacyldisaccharide 4'-kinase [Oleisolibacter albus]|uniref:tetraacyldisaccharide 4'-kinase n=1 Tax=Oleisolibacter albus TaxID=2171757 RepID=UPI000DF47676|nr:tetraacyldisaccharide 4'-kinase [Oleisolibacter albus]